MKGRKDATWKAVEQLEREIAERTLHAKREIATPEKHAVGVRMDLIRDCNRKLFDVKVILREQAKQCVGRGPKETREHHRLGGQIMTQEHGQTTQIFSLFPCTL
jgi:hypothetical protein